MLLSSHVWTWALPFSTPQSAARPFRPRCWLLRFIAVTLGGLRRPARVRDGEVWGSSYPALGKFTKEGGQMAKRFKRKKVSEYRPTNFLGRTQMGPPPHKKKASSPFWGVRGIENKFP